MKEAQQELGELLNRSTRLFSDVLLDLLTSIAKDLTGNTVVNKDRLVTLSWQTTTLADLLGRRRLLLEVKQKFKRTPINFGITPVVPNVEFKEAIRDIVSREPRLAGTAEEVSRLYRTRHAFAIARSADMVITERVQAFIGQAIKEGYDIPKATKVIEELGGFTRAYAETVYRTNVATAYTAGRFQQAFDPDLADEALAFEYEAVLDADTRENHAAAHGLIAPKSSPVWDQFSPPMGFNCRCDVVILSRHELSQRGMLERDGRVMTYRPSSFRNAHPDSGFGRGRPDRLIYS